VFVISVSGPQGSGKSTLARAIGQRLQVPALSRDPLMGAIKESGYPASKPEDLQKLGLVGYRLQGVLIEQLLAQGHSVVLECIAPPSIREAWRKTAQQHGAQFVMVDTVVSDRTVHRARLEHRENSGAGGWRRIVWSEVEATMAALGPPTAGALVADAINPVAANVDLAVAALSGQAPSQDAAGT
jgi:predicted kinase